MIGNDIVDLKLAQKESNWKRPRFLDKIFTQKEQNLIVESAQPDQLVWLFWSMKESAYKLHVQIYEKRFFAPKKLECKILKIDKGKVSGLVYCAGFQCFVKSVVTDDFVYSIAKKDQNKLVFSNRFLIEDSKIETQHKTVFRKAKAHFAKQFQTPIEEIRIQKNELGVPFFYSKKQNFKVPVSTTHHGKFGAFAYHKVI